jgi:hypothetical protein
MSDIDLIAKKIRELRALRNPKPMNVVPLFPPAVPRPYEAAAAIGLSVLGATMLLLVLTIAVLLG